MSAGVPESAKRGTWASVARWFDGWAVAESRRDSAEKVDWLRITPFLLLHVAALGTIFTGAGFVAVGTAIGLYFVRLFAITGFYHRYFSHRAYKTNRFWQFVFAILGNAAAQRGPLWWATHHRFHHKHADETVDRHSPRQRGFLWSHTGWFTARNNFRTDLESVRDLAKYPELVFLDRFAGLVPALLFAALYGVGFWAEHSAPHLRTNGLQMLTWGILSTVVLYHVTYTINSLAHVYGKRRYQTTDDSRNNLWLALLTLGEGWHNNHQRYQASARNGFFAREIDVTWYALKLLERIGVIRDLVPVPESVLAEGRAADAASAPRSSSPMS